jgi:hypothetical protein
MTTLALSKRGSLTLPPELRRKMGLDKVRNPMLPRRRAVPAAGGDCARA